MKRKLVIGLNSNRPRPYTILYYSKQDIQTICMKPIQFNRTTIGKFAILKTGCAAVNVHTAGCINPFGGRSANHVLIYDKVI